MILIDWLDSRQQKVVFFYPYFKAKTKLGEAVKPVFILTLHTRDYHLINSLIKYLHCGNINYRQEAMDFKVTKIKDIL